LRTQYSGGETVRDTSRAAGVELAKHTITHTISAAAVAGAYVSTTTTGQVILASATVTHGALALLSPGNVDDIVEVGTHVAYTAITASIALIVVAAVVALFVAYIWIRPRWCSMHAVCRAIKYASINTTSSRGVYEFPMPTVMLLENRGDDEDDEDTIGCAVGSLVANYDRSGLMHWIHVQFPEAVADGDIARMRKSQLALLCSKLGMPVDHLDEYPKRG
jgi:hypothetical protein